MVEKVNEPILLKNKKILSQSTILARKLHGKRVCNIMKKKRMQKRKKIKKLNSLIKKISKL